MGSKAVLEVIGKVDWPICNVMRVFRLILAHMNARVLGLGSDVRTVSAFCRNLTETEGDWPVCNICVLLHIETHKCACFRPKQTLAP